MGPVPVLVPLAHSRSAWDQVVVKFIVVEEMDLESCGCTEMLVFIGSAV